MVYLIRHAQDFKPTKEQENDPNFQESSLWEKKADGSWFEETLPDGRTVSYQFKRLSKTGIEQTTKIRNFILNHSKWSAHRYHPIEQVIFMDPNGKNPDGTYKHRAPSPNTMNTVLPLINALQSEEQKK